MEETNELEFDQKKARRTFSRVGFAMVGVVVASTLVQILWSLGLQATGAEISTTWSAWLPTIVSYYLIAMPFGVLLLRGLPAKKPEDTPMSFKRLAILFCMGYAVMIGGGLIGTVLSFLLSGGQAVNNVAELAQDTNPLKVLVVVILAPILEEYICRKQLIDRMAVYGEKTAVLLSGLMFGLMHQNFYQFFGTFAFGVLLGYVYIRSGRLRYPVILHIVVNFIGSVIAPKMLEVMNMEELTADTVGSLEEMMEIVLPRLPGMLAMYLYSMCITGVIVFGTVMLIVRFKRAVWVTAPQELPRGRVFKTAYINAGVIVYAALCLAFCILALF